MESRKIQPDLRKTGPFGSRRYLNLLIPLVYPLIIFIVLFASFATGMGVAAGPSNAEHMAMLAFIGHPVVVISLLVLSAFLTIAASYYFFHNRRYPVLRMKEVLRDIEKSRDAILNENKDLEQARLELAQRASRMEKANKNRSEFLSTMSHEIRTPLNAIVNSANLLLYENPRKDQLENLEILKFSGESLLRLINGILDYSRIDSGKIELEYVFFDLRKILESIRHSLEPEARKKRLKMELVITDNIPLIINGDPGRLAQVLFNLVGNAVKFTEQGKVSVTVAVAGDSEDMVELMFRVQDTGIGIPEEMQDKIFDAFTQAGSSITRQYGGTGLGLSISKMLVELQGGRMELESQPGKGSIFTFFLKFKKALEQENPEEAAGTTSFQNLNGMKILIVEDNPINQKIVVKLLSNWNAVTEIAENGLVAVEKVSADHFDLVLMDLHMPDMNGYEATSRIRELEGNYFKSLPILALTASAFIEDRTKIFNHGMNGYIIKPFSPAELNMKISNFIRQTNPSQ